MTHPIELRVLELLAARLCHDLIGPVSAIGNGVELLGEDDPDFVRDAVALVGDSARKANRSLQFYRFLYGFSGGGLTGPAQHGWPPISSPRSGSSAITAPQHENSRSTSRKLACAMLARGGRGVAARRAAGSRHCLKRPEIEATGGGAGPSPEARAALGLMTAPANLTTRTVGAYFADCLRASRGAAYRYRPSRRLSDRPDGRVDHAGQ